MTEQTDDGGILPSGMDAGEPYCFPPIEIKRYNDLHVARSLGALLQQAPDITHDSVVLYPGSAADSTFADVIGKNVVHIDPDSESMNVLSAEGYSCECSTIEDYVKAHKDSGTIDMVISYNAGTVSDELSDMVRPGGYVIANNWHESANVMGDREDFEIVCAVPIGGEELIKPDAARKGLGYYVCAILLASGKMLTDPGEIANLPKGTYLNMTEAKNTETLWLFRKKTL